MMDDDDDDFYINNDDDEDYDDDDEDDYSDEDEEDEVNKNSQPKNISEKSTPPLTSDTATNEIAANSCPAMSTSSDNPNIKFSTSVRAGTSSSFKNKHNNQELAEEFRYEVLTPEKICSYMIDVIDEVNQVLELPSTQTRILLHHFRWDKEKLMERFYDGDQERLFKDAHIVNPFSSSRNENKSKSSKNKNFNASAECEICFLPADDKGMNGLECGHRFCRECWGAYLKTKIMDEGMGTSISCAAHNCNILVDDVTVMSLVDDPRVRAKYQHLITNSFVACNRLIRWCPAPDCPNAVKAHYFDAQSVQCDCGHVFCFGCGENWHDPVRCKWLRKWIKKCDDDSETSNWIAANTKECPKCHVTIEKNGGCNHIICKNQACRTEFCWVCLGAWEPHGSSWYNCNRFNEDDAKKARDAQERSRHALQRYLHYCNRYMNHNQSLKLEQKLMNSIREKMEEMQQHNMSWIEVQFLKKAVEVLCLCRQTLMYTYAFAFYLMRNNHSIIFEDNQADLEIAVEKLSGYLEREITSDNAVDTKQKVQDKYRYCEQRRKVLLDHVHEGYEKDYWEYQDDL